MMKLTLPLAAATLALFTTQGVLADSLIHHGGGENNSSFVYRGGASREAEITAREAEEDKVAAKQAQDEMRAATRDADAPGVDKQETASTMPDAVPEELRTIDPVSGRPVRAISMERPAEIPAPVVEVEDPDADLETMTSGPEATMDNAPMEVQMEAPSPTAPTPADLDGDTDAPSMIENTESPDSTDSVEE